jgi:pilus assembly protein TadC
MANISCIIKMKNIKFTKIKYALIIGLLFWGISTATIMNLFDNNPFELHIAIIIYVVFMLGGFAWGIITYSLTKKLENKKKNKTD